MSRSKCRQMYIEPSFFTTIARVARTQSANIFYFVAASVLLHPIGGPLAIHALMRR